MSPGYQLFAETVRFHRPEASDYDIGIVWHGQGLLTHALWDSVAGRLEAEREGRLKAEKALVESISTGEA